MSTAPRSDTRPWEGPRQPAHPQVASPPTFYPSGRCEALLGPSACCGFEVRCSQVVGHGGSHAAMYDRCDSWPTVGYVEVP